MNIIYRGTVLKHYYLYPVFKIIFILVDIQSTLKFTPLTIILNIL